MAHIKTILLHLLTIYPNIMFTSYSAAIANSSIHSVNRTRFFIKRKHVNCSSASFVITCNVSDDYHPIFRMDYFIHSTHNFLKLFDEYFYCEIFYLKINDCGLNFVLSNNVFKNDLYIFFPAYHHVFLIVQP